MNAIFFHSAVGAASAAASAAIAAGARASEAATKIGANARDLADVSPCAWTAVGLHTHVKMLISCCWRLLVNDAGLCATLGVSTPSANADASEGSSVKRQKRAGMASD